MAIASAVGMIVNIAIVRLVPDRRLDWLNYMAAGMCLTVIILRIMWYGEI